MGDATISERRSAMAKEERQEVVANEPVKSRGMCKDLEAAQRDFGPCGKVIMAMQKSRGQITRGEPDFDLVFGLEACLNQHLEKCTYDTELTFKMQTMALVFGEPSSDTPRHVAAARTKAHSIDWVEKMKET